MSLRIKLVDLLDKSNPIFQLAEKINWDHLEQQIGKTYAEGPGRPETPVRLIAGLHYLKYLENKSDEEIVTGFVENPYWQYFCGCEYFEHKLPLHPTTLVKWRKKLGLKELEKLLSETLEVAKKENLLKKSDYVRVNIDTTAQEKAISFPVDSKLYHKMRRKIVKEAKKINLTLRQTYERVGQKALKMQFRYSHARKMRLSRAQGRKVKNFLGRVVRDIQRQSHKFSESSKMNNLIAVAKRLLSQKRNDKNKLYSIHATEVHCIAKGKSHKKYEFGCKVAVATTSSNNWIIGVDSWENNPYDGHTLERSIDQVLRLSDQRPKQLFVDRGYKGSKSHHSDIQVMIAGRRKKVTAALRKHFKRRSAIEPVIGHLKADHRMGRNFLLGVRGDRINAFLSACAFNLKKIINAFQAVRKCPMPA